MAAKTTFEGKHVLGHERDGWEFVERKKGKEAVAMIAVTNDGKLILTEQYRRPVDARVIDLAAGLVGDEGDDDPASTARKELEEEAGYACERVEELTAGPTSPGITSAIVRPYPASRLARTETWGGDVTAEITVRVRPLEA